MRLACIYSFYVQLTERLPEFYKFSLIFLQINDSIKIPAFLNKTIVIQCVIMKCVFILTMQQRITLNLIFHTNSEFETDYHDMNIACSHKSPWFFSNAFDSSIKFRESVIYPRNPIYSVPPLDVWPNHLELLTVLKKTFKQLTPVDAPLFFFVFISF